MTPELNVMVGVWVFRPAAGGHEGLQLLRSPGRYMAGTWQTVSGGIEPGDSTTHAAARRELREETGLTDVQLFNAGHVETFYIADGDTLWHRVNFAALTTAAATITLNDEHTDHRWLSLSDLRGSITWDSERGVIDTIEREILNRGPSYEHLRTGD